MRPINLTPFSGTVLFFKHYKYIMAEDNACCDIVILGLTNRQKEKVGAVHGGKAVYVRKHGAGKEAADLLAGLRKDHPRLLQGMYVIPYAHRDTDLVSFHVIQLGQYEKGGPGRHGSYSKLHLEAERVNVAGGSSHNLFGAPSTVYTFPTLKQLKKYVERPSASRRGLAPSIRLVDRSVAALAAAMGAASTGEAEADAAAGRELGRAALAAASTGVAAGEAKADAAAGLELRRAALAAASTGVGASSGVVAEEEEADTAAVGALLGGIRDDADLVALDPGTLAQVQKLRQLMTHYLPSHCRGDRVGGSSRTRRRRVRRRRRRTAHKKKPRRQRKTRQLTCCRRELTRKSKRVRRGRSRGRRTRRSR